MRILIPNFRSDEYRQAIKAAFPDVTVDVFQLRPCRRFFARGKVWSLHINGKAADNDDLKDVAVCVASNDLTKESTIYLLERCPQIKWIYSRSTGVDHLMAPEIKTRGIWLGHPHLCSEAMGEYVLAVILSISRRFTDHYRLQQKGVWQFVPAQMLAGKRAGILGVGHVGQVAARRLKQNGMEVWGLGRSARGSLSGFDRYLTINDLKSFLAQCDFLIAALPVTDSTYRCLNAETITCMKKNAWLINIGRGELIDNQALLHALRDQKIGGACLDVVDQNLKNKIRSLGKHPNLLLTHHSSFSYPEYNDDNLKIFMEELKRYMAGQKPQHLVDVEKGY